jgi:hypothetical protein
MQPLSDRARAALDGFREADVLPEAGRKRILEGVADRVAQGQMPPAEVDIAPPQPVAGLGAGAKLLIGLAVGVVAVPAVIGLLDRGDQGIEQVSAPAPAVATVDIPVEPVAEPPAPVPAEPLAEDPEPEVRELAAQPKRARKEPPPKPAPQTKVPTIDAEMKLLKAAQAALRAGDAERALSRLAHHRRRFPSGKLADLREVVRIEALCRLGRNDEAAKASREFLGKRPGSPHSHRVRGGCDTIEP